MRKWILTKELFDSDDLKSQNEIPYLQGNLANTYYPLGDEKMNLNHLLMRCHYLTICLGTNVNNNHYSSYVDGVYLFIFINDEYRCHIALNLLEKDFIELACILYENPIDNNDIESSIILSHINIDITMDELVDFLNKDCLEVFADFGFSDIIDFNKESSLSKMN